MLLIFKFSKFQHYQLWRKICTSIKRATGPAADSINIPCCGEENLAFWRLSNAQQLQTFYASSLAKPFQSSVVCIMKWLWKYNCKIKPYCYSIWFINLPTPRHHVLNITFPAQHSTYWSLCRKHKLWTCFVKLDSLNVRRICWNFLASNIGTLSKIAFWNGSDIELELRNKSNSNEKIWIDRGLDIKTF